MSDRHASLRRGQTSAKSCKRLLAAQLGLTKLSCLYTLLLHTVQHSTRMHADCKVLLTRCFPARLVWAMKRERTKNVSASAFTPSCLFFLAFSVTVYALFTRLRRFTRQGLSLRDVPLDALHLTR